METIKRRLETVFSSPISVDDKLQKVCMLLHEEIDHYNWVGFYFANEERTNLHLGPYVGEPTDHDVIPFGKGICGQVAVSNEIFVVPDVSAQENYLACSIDTKSEIVVPIFKNGINVGQIDIDSHQVDPFTKEDVELLEFICQKVSEVIGWKSY